MSSNGGQGEYFSKVESLSTNWWTEGTILLQSCHCPPSGGYAGGGHRELPLWQNVTQLFLGHDHSTLTVATGS